MMRVRGRADGSKPAGRRRRATPIVAAQPFERREVLLQLGRRIDHGRFRPGVSIEVLDVGHVSPGAAQAGGERVADLVGGERRPSGAAGGGGERAIDAAAGPRPEGVGVEEGAGGGDALGHEGNGGEAAALAARDGDVGDRLVEPEVVGLEAAHLRGAHPGPVHQFQPDAGHRAGLELGEDRGDVAAVDPTRLRRRRGEADEVEQVERGAAAVEDADEVRERVAAVVAGRGGERVAPLVQLRIERGQVSRERERAEVAEPGQPHPQLALAVVEGDQRAPDLIEVAAGVVVQGVALAFGGGSAGWRAARRGVPGWS